jgi:hypothetical protein
VLIEESLRALQLYAPRMVLLDLSLLKVEQSKFEVVLRLKYPSTVPRLGKRAL